jgi:hypothetical protein
MVEDDLDCFEDVKRRRLRHGLDRRYEWRRPGCLRVLVHEGKKAQTFNYGPCPLPRALLNVVARPRLSFLEEVIRGRKTATGTSVSTSVF